MNQNRTFKFFLFLLRLAITLVFLLYLFAIDFGNPKDIISLTTLHRLTHPSLLSQMVEKNIRQTTQLLAQTQTNFILLALAVQLFCILMLTLRWKILLRAQDMNFGFCRLIAYYFIGFFFNNFLPTNIGGDFSRIYNTGKKEGKMTESAAIIFMERFLGFVAVFILAGIAILFHLEWAKSHSVLYSLLLFATGIILVFWILFDPKIRQRIKLTLEKMRFHKLQEILRRFYVSLSLFREHRKTLLIVFGISFIYQFTLVFVNLASAYAVGAKPPILPLFFAIQITTLVCVIPLSINGLGVREYLYIQILGMAGVAAMQTLSFQIILFGISYILSLFGGFCFLLQKGTKKIRKSIGTLNGLSRNQG